MNLRAVGGQQTDDNSRVVTRQLMNDSLRATNTQWIDVHLRAVDRQQTDANSRVVGKQQKKDSLRTAST